MLARLGPAVARHPRLAVLVWFVVAVCGYGLAVLGVHGESLFDRLSSGAPGVPGSQSTEGQRLLAAADTSGDQVTLVVSGLDPADPGVATVMADADADLAALPGVASVVDPYVLPDGPANPAAANLLARDGDGFLVVVTLDPALDGDRADAAAGAVVDRLRDVPDALAEVAPGATGIVGSDDLVLTAITDQVEEDLATGEAVALPVALLVMVLVFGGFLAASMPMAGALASIGAGLGALLGLSYLIDVDAAVVNVVTLLGLGLSIDYGLLVVSRFREELHQLTDDGTASGAPGVAGTAAGPPTGATPAVRGAGLPARTRRRRGSRDPLVQEAVRRTVATAGRTVTFSALTVAISIAGLVVFRPDILRAIGAAGLAVVLVAVATAVTLVPALLTLSGRRLVGPGLLDRVPFLRAVLARTADVRSDEGFFSRLAARVQRHPWWTTLGTLAVLGVLAAPVAGLQMRTSGVELLPASAPQRQFVEQLTEQYPASGAPEVVVVAGTDPATAQAWADDALAGIEHVESVVPAAASGERSVIGLHVEGGDAGGAEAGEVVQDVRALDPPFPVWVTGQAAAQVDFVDALGERVGWAVGVVALATLVLLFLMTGSVVVPVKALLTNAVSLAASLGVLVWSFQDGHLGGLLGFSSPGGVETYVVALVVAFAFGLAMDYEVFLLSRITELHEQGLPDDEAVRLGLQRSGRIITSAAAIIVVVFAGFVAGRLLVIKEVGFALAVAVVVDATLVRMLLVPATMTLLGRWNWWAPGPLRRLHRRAAITH